MGITFKKITGQTTYLDPRHGFELTQPHFEIRFDPLTNRTGRIVNIGGLNLDPPDVDALVKRSLEIGCPFCKESMDTMAAKFLEDFAPGGRIRRGEAVVIPNVIPFDAHAAICVISEDHFIPLDGFTAEALGDAFSACQDFLGRGASEGSDGLYFSINWNYMPPAGSSIVHPHLQPIAGETPTNAHRELIRACHEYVSQYMTHYWRDFIEKEVELGERYLGRTGKVVWTVPFVPSGSYPDTMAVFWECVDLLMLDDQDFLDFARGLVAVLRFYHSLGVYSFNLTLFSGRKGDTTLWAHSKITPRCLPRPIGNSDVTYFGLLHREPIAVMRPEDMASRMKPFFSD